MFGYILLKNQEITFALAHLQARQQQTTPIIAEMDFCEIWIQTRLKLKTEERWIWRQIEIDDLNPFASSAWKSSLNTYLITSWKASRAEINILQNENRVNQEM